MAAASNTFTATIFLFAVAFLTAHHVADGRHVGTEENSRHEDNLVAEVCANASLYYGRPRHNMSKEFCESTIRSDKRSATAKDRRDLALIALDLLQRAADDANAKIIRGDGPKWHKDKVTRLHLVYCQVDYDTMARTISKWRAMVQEYGDNRNDSLLSLYYFDVASRMKATSDDWLAVTSVEDNELQVVGKDVEEVSHRTTLARAMVEQMLGEVDDDMD